MLPSQHGVSTLAKSLRRPIVSTLTMSNKENNAGFATSSKVQGVQNGHSARSSVSRIWTPQHGIVFGTGQAPGLYRGLSTAASEEMRGLQLLSDAEDSYVMADAFVPEPQSTGMSSIAQRLGRKPVKKEDRTASAMKALVDAKKEEAVSSLKRTSNPKKSARDAKAEAYAAALKELQQSPEQNEVPETATSFKMTEETFRAAKNSPEGSPESFWTHKLYRGPDAAGQKPVIHYCRSKTTTERVLQTYFMDQKVIGFDIEWKAVYFGKDKENKGIRENVSLIQIACEERIALFHLALYPKGDEVEDLCSPLLKKILEDPEVTKVGVAIRGDCTRVKKWLDIDSKGMFELSHLHKLLKYSKSKETHKINKSMISLAKQVQEHLHLPMSKDLNVRASNWSKPLVLDQIVYAAADSYAGFQLFHTMEHKRRLLDPMPPCPYHVEHEKPIRFIKETEADEEEPDLGDIIGAADPLTEKGRERVIKRLAEEATSISEEDAELLETSETRPKRKYKRRAAKDVSAEVDVGEAEEDIQLAEKPETEAERDYTRPSSAQPHA